MDFTYSFNKRPTPAAGELSKAAWFGDVRAIEDLVSRGADVNEQVELGFTPLILAAGMGRLEAVRKLLDLGADPGRPDKSGMTALMQAEKNGNHAIARLLREWPNRHRFQPPFMFNP